MTNQNVEYKVVKNPINYLIYLAAGVLLIVAYFLFMIPLTWLGLVAVVILVHFLMSHALKYNAIRVELKKNMEEE